MKKNETAPEAKKDDAREALRRAIQNKLIAHGVTEPASPTPAQLYRAAVAVMKEKMLADREAFKRRTNRVQGKKVCYLCMEFLLGRSFRMRICASSLRSLGRILIPFITVRWIRGLATVA